MRKLVVVSVLVLSLSILPFISHIEATPFSEDYDHRREYNITGSAGAGTDYTVEITVNRSKFEFLAEHGGITHQGVATDGTYIWTSGSTTIRKYEKNGTYLYNRTGCDTDGNGEQTQINHMCYYDGYLWVGSNNYGNGTDRSWIFKYQDNGTTINFIEQTDYLTWMNGSDVVALNEGGWWHDAYFWTVFGNIMYCLKYNSTWDCVGEYELTYPITDSGESTGYQGNTFHGNYMICTIHEGRHPQDIIDVYYWNGSAFEEYARLASPSPTTETSQGLHIDPNNSSVIWLARRYFNGTASTAINCTINWFCNCLEDFGDIRFYDDDGVTALPYFLETKVDGDYATFWVKVADNLDSNQTIYMYYANNTISAGVMDSTEDAFIFYDDFSGLSLNGTKWTESNYGGSGTCTVSDGICDLYNQYRIWSNTNMTVNMLTKMNVSVDGFESGKYQYWGVGVDNASSNKIYPASYAGQKRFYSANGTSSYEVSAFPDPSSYHEWEIKFKSGHGILDVDGTNYNDKETNIPSDDAELPCAFGAATTSDHLYIDYVLTRKWVDPEPAFTSWGEEENNPYNTDPENLYCVVSDMDDSDNLYAQRKLYTLEYNVKDVDGFSTINYSEVRLKQGASIRAVFRFTEDTATFSIETGSTEWTLDASSSNISSGIYLNVTFKFNAHYDAIEEAGLDLECYVIDNKGATDTDTMQSNYADVVTTILVSNFACDDDRGNTEQTIKFIGTLYYADDPSSSSPSSFSPPDSEITAVHIYDSGNVDKASNSTLSGVFSIGFTAPSSPGTETYNAYIDGADAEFTDFEDSSTDTFITDNLQTFNLQTVEYLGSAQYQYEAQIKYGSDSSPIDGATLNLTLPSGSVIGQLTSNSTGWVTFVLAQSNATESGTYNLFGVNDNSYGVTVTGANVTFNLVNWTLTSKDNDGNVLSSTTIKVENGSSTVYNSGADTIRVPEATFNITIRWQSLTVNTTSNLAISGATTSNFTCTAYPYTYEGTTYWCASNATISSTTWVNGILTVRFSGVVTTYVLKCSCTTKPVYILNLTYDYDTDWSSLLTLTHYGNTTIQLKYTNWGGTVIQRSDKRLTAVAWSGETMSVTATGTAGEVGTLEVYCSSRGEPDTTDGFATTAYSSARTVFTGTYVFSSEKTVSLTWSVSGQATESGYDQTPSLFLVAFDVIVPQSITAGVSCNGTLDLEWQGSNVIYVYDLVFSRNASWFIVLDSLPLKLVKSPETSAGEALLFIDILVPEDTPPGDYSIPCELLVRNEGYQDTTVSGMVNFTVLGANYNIPQYMTIIFLGVIALIIIGSVVHRKHRKH